jgi:4-nitrophenyl phosphatase/phosphoglycolate phosphatase
MKPNLAVFLVGSVFVGNGRRTQLKETMPLHLNAFEELRNSGKALAAFLLASNPPAALRLHTLRFGQAVDPATSRQTTADGIVTQDSDADHWLRSRPIFALAGGATTAPPADAVSMKEAGICEKLSVPSDLLDKTDVFIFDCDGVIWKGDSLIDGVPAVLDMLRKAGKKIFFVTNNSTKSRKGYLGKFKSLGLEGVEAEEIFSSSFAAAAYLEQTNFKDKGKKVYIIGEVGIEEELDLIGVPWIGGGSDAGKKIELKSGFALPHDEDVGAVIVGFDREISYFKIQYAQLCINENPGCEFIATNLDAVTHLTDAQEWAGNGAMAGAIKGCTGQEPTLVGKPSPLMIDYIVSKYGCDRERICMVGDRLDTDILFGQNNGLLSCLTLSGVTTESKLLSQENAIKPDYYVDSIADFMTKG